MHSVWFGEFLGRCSGVAGQRCLCRCHVAQVLRGRRGLDGDRYRWALACCAACWWRSLRQPGANLNRPSLWPSLSSTEIIRSWRVCGRRNYLELCARGADGCALCVALEANARSGGQAGHLLHQRGVRNPLINTLNEALARRCW